MNPRVRTVVPNADYTLELTFANGEFALFDCKHLLDLGVFQELKDIGYFKRARVELGTVTWPHGQDICPDTLYEDSRRIPSSSEQRAAHLDCRP